MDGNGLVLWGSLELFLLAVVFLPTFGLPGVLALVPVAAGLLALGAKAVPDGSGQA